MLDIFVFLTDIFAFIFGTESTVKKIQEQKRPTFRAVVYSTRQYIRKWSNIDGKCQICRKHK